MSQANRVGKQNARERVLAEKIARQKAERRRRQMIIGGVVVVVIAVAGGVGILVNNAKKNSDTGAYLAPAGAVVDPQAKSDKDLGIHVGSSDAPVKVVVFEDFRCPVCQEIEGAVEPTYKQYVEAGKVQITYHPVRLIDGNNGGVGSLNGGNAAACAQDQNQFYPMHDLLYANQPDEKTDGYGDKSKILALADQIPALKANTAFQSCVNQGQHNGWVQANADQFNKLQLPGTPTMFVDGTQLTFGQQSQAATLQYFQGQLDAAFKKDGGKAGTPVTLPTAPTSAPSSGAPSSGASSSAPSAPSASGSSTASSGAPSSAGSTPTSSKS